MLKENQKWNFKMKIALTSIRMGSHRNSSVRVRRVPRSLSRVSWTLRWVSRALRWVRLVARCAGCLGVGRVGSRASSRNGLVGCLRVRVVRAWRVGHGHLGVPANVVGRVRGRLVDGAEGHHVGLLWWRRLHLLAHVHAVVAVVVITGGLGPAFAHLDEAEADAAEDADGRNDDDHEGAGSDPTAAVAAVHRNAL